MKKKIEQNEWKKVHVDGKVIGVIEETDEASKWLWLISGLEGISISPATQGDLLKFKAMTKLPPRCFGEKCEGCKEGDEGSATKDNFVVRIGVLVG